MIQMVRWLADLPARIWRACLAAAPVKVWAQIGAAMAMTLVFVGFGLVIWLGPWLDEHQGKQIDWLGWGMVLAAALVLVALAAITGLNITFRGGRDGLSGTIDQDRPGAEVETVTRTTVAPKPAVRSEPQEGDNARPV